MAIASLVVSCAAVLGLCSYGGGGVLGIVGAILGHVARGRIRRAGKSGDGMARAGIIVGWVFTALCIVLAHAHEFDSTGDQKVRTGPWSTKISGARLP